MGTGTCPNSSSYSDAYYQAGLFGGDCPTIMAHCVWLKDEEISLIKKQGVFIAIVLSLIQIFPQVLHLFENFWMKGFWLDLEVTWQEDTVLLF